jgi:glutaredoxin 3
MAHIEIFTGPNCGYCERAEALLAERGLPFDDLDTSDEAHRGELIRRLPRVRAVPQIFIDGQHIGGCEDLEIIAGDGRLDAMIGG